MKECNPSTSLIKIIEYHIHQIIIAILFTWEQFFSEVIEDRRLDPQTFPMNFEIDTSNNKRKWTITVLILHFARSRDYWDDFQSLMRRNSAYTP